MISDQTLKQAVSYIVLHGKEAASKHFNLSSETVSRYVRDARGRGLIDDIDDVINKRPNVLVLDIETTPMIVSAWRLGKSHILTNNVLEDRHLLSYAVKWLFEPDVFADILTPAEVLSGDDKRITEDVWEFVDHADIIIAHNGKRFDMAMLNTRFIMNDINPPSPYQIIDTLLAFRSIGNFSSNKQGYLNKVLCLTEKMEHEGLEMWHKCKAGDPDALHTMLEYNKIDIFGLEEMYVKIRPWIKGHPNMSLYHDGVDMEDCHRCGGEIEYINKPYVTPMNRYSSYRCKECGGIGRSRSSELTTVKRKSLTASVSR